MGLAELFLIGLGLSMDAFAVSISKGLSMKKMIWRNAVVAGMYFGIFQAAMPLIGYLLGSQFEEKITSIDHWVAFVLLVIIGGNMIKESREEDKKLDESFRFKTMLLLAVATSIDALAVGITFAFLSVNIYLAIIIIGITTFLVSILGVRIGNLFGSRYRSKAELAGGLILIGMGIKILIEHMG